MPPLEPRRPYDWEASQPFDWAEGTGGATPDGLDRFPTRGENEVAQPVEDVIEPTSVPESNLRVNAMAVALASALVAAFGYSFYGATVGDSPDLGNAAVVDLPDVPYNERQPVDLSAYRIKPIAILPSDFVLHGPIASLTDSPLRPIPKLSNNWFSDQLGQHLNFDPSVVFLRSSRTKAQILSEPHPFEALTAEVSELTNQAPGELVVAFYPEAIALPRVEGDLECGRADVESGVAVIWLGSFDKDSGRKCFSNPGENVTVQRVVIATNHEILHLLGSPHVENPKNIMFPRMPRNPDDVVVDTEDDYIGLTNEQIQTGEQDIGRSPYWQGPGDVEAIEQNLIDSNWMAGINSGEVWTGTYPVKDGWARELGEYTIYVHYSGSAIFLFDPIQQAYVARGGADQLGFPVDSALSDDHKVQIVDVPGGRFTYSAGDGVDFVEGSTRNMQPIDSALKAIVGRRVHVSTSAPGLEGLSLSFALR